MAQTAYRDAKTSTITYGDRVQGFLAVPERGTGPFGAVVLCHERYGLVQHTLDLAAKFAAYGYVCLAPDMFSHFDGDKEALHRGDVRAYISDADIRRFLGAGLDYLLEHPDVDSAAIAAMGVCQS